MPSSSSSSKASITVRQLRRDESGDAARLHRRGIRGLANGFRRQLATRLWILLFFGSFVALFVYLNWLPLALVTLLLFAVFVYAAPHVGMSDFFRTCRDHADMYSYYERDGRRMLVAVVDNRVVGTIAVVETDKPASAELIRVSVDTQYRRLGIARLLLSHIEAYAREYGYRRIELQTSTVQTAAIELYKSNGYRLYRTVLRPVVAGLPLAGATILFFEKKL